jgi:Na+-transporting methylmalonyl-CoA/oxaloacetate decarboxylase gamma subunit
MFFLLIAAYDPVVVYCTLTIFIVLILIIVIIILMGDVILNVIVCINLNIPIAESPKLSEILRPVECEPDN